MKMSSGEETGELWWKTHAHPRTHARTHARAHTHTHTRSGVQVNCGEHTQALVNKNMHNSQETGQLWWKVTQSVVNIQVSCSEQRGELWWTDRSVNRQGHCCAQTQKLWWKDSWAVVNRHELQWKDMWALVNRWWPVVMNREVCCSGHMSWLADKWAVVKTQDLWWMDRWVLQASTTNLMIPVAPVQELFYLSPKWGTANHIYNGVERNSVLSGSLSPRHGASSGCGWRNGLRYRG
jgi:hypothetical protein